MSEDTEGDGVTGRGRCLCGGVSYHTTGPLRPVWNCHCERCRRTTGHFMAATAVDAENLVLDAGATLRWYLPPDDPTVGYGFCAECGGTVLWRSWDRAGTPTVSIAAGTLDPPTGLSTSGALFCAHASDYHRLDPDLDNIAEDRDP
jgi:hypothetical protein